MRYQKIINSMKGERRELEPLIRAKGSDALQEIARAYGIRPDKARKCLKAAGLEGIKHKPNFELEKLALEEGLPQTKIAAMLNTTRQTVSNYLIRRELIGEFKKERELVKKQRKNEKDARTQNLAHFRNLMIQRALSLARQESWAEEQALKYCLFPKVEKRKLKRFEKLKDIFQIYESEKAKGNKITYCGLARLSRFNLTPSEIRRVFLVTQGESFMATQINPRRPYSENSKQAIKRASDLKMRREDIAYLVEAEFSEKILEHQVSNILAKIRSREGCTHYHIATFEFGENDTAYLSYKLASQIYQRIDSGSKHLQIRNELGIRQEVLEYALNFRGGIEKRIIEALDTINPGKKHTAPYKA